MELKMHPHAVALTAITYSTDGEAACYSGGETLPWGSMAWLCLGYPDLQPLQLRAGDLPKSLGPGRARELVSMSVGSSAS